MVQVNLLLGGLPTQLDKEEYTHLLSEHLDIKSEREQDLLDFDRLSHHAFLKY